MIFRDQFTLTDHEVLIAGTAPAPLWFVVDPAVAGSVGRAIAYGQNSATGLYAGVILYNGLLKVDSVTGLIPKPLGEPSNLRIEHTDGIHEYIVLVTDVFALQIFPVEFVVGAGTGTDPATVSTVRRRVFHTKAPVEVLPIVPPPLPEPIMRQFPELRAWNMKWMKWAEEMNQLQEN